MGYPGACRFSLFNYILTILLYSIDPNSELGIGQFHWLCRRVCVRSVSEAKIPSLPSGTIRSPLMLLTKPASLATTDSRLERNTDT